MIRTQYSVEIKDPDGLFNLTERLGVKDSQRFVEFGDNARIDLEVNEKLEIVGGRFVPISEW